MFTWDNFWDLNKVWFTLVGVALTAFLSIGAIYLAWWINDGFGIIMVIILALFALIGGGAVLSEPKTDEK